jgi:hypothetical protein
MAFFRCRPLIEPANDIAGDFEQRHALIQMRLARSFENTALRRVMEQHERMMAKFGI